MAAGAKDKVRAYVKFKNITYYDFEKKANLSFGILKTGKHFRSDQIQLIRDNIPDLNINWVLYDEGNMIVDDKTVKKKIELKQIKDDYIILKKAFSHAIISLDEKDEEIERLKKRLK